MHWADYIMVLNIKEVEKKNKHLFSLHIKLQQLQKNYDFTHQQYPY